MQWLADLIVGAFEWLFDLVVAVLELAGTIAVDLACYLLDGLGQFLTWAVGGVNLDGLATKAENMWSAVPRPLLEFAFNAGLVDCLSIIGAALLIRLALQLVPFTRLGS